jgi:hypothetical protein
MSESDAQRLSRQESVETFRAEEALKAADGDFEDARDRIREAPDGLKFRFSSQEEDVYGLGVLKFQSSPPTLKSMSVLVANDESLGTVSLGQTPSEVSNELVTRSDDASSMSALTTRLREGLDETLDPPPENWITLIENRNENELQLQLEDMVKDILKQDDIVLAAELEAGLVDGPEEETPESDADHEEDEEDENEESEEKEEEEEEEETEDVTLLCDIKVSPLKGKSVQNLQPGEAIYVDISDNEDHQEIVDVLDNLRDDETGLIPVKIDSIAQTQTDKVEITVQFGENVFGRTVAGKDMNLMAPGSVSKPVGGGSEIVSLLPWMLAGIGLVILGIFLLWNWVF